MKKSKINLYIIIIFVISVSCSKKEAGKDGFNDVYKECVNNSIRSRMLIAVDSNYDIFNTIDYIIIENQKTPDLTEQSLKKAILNQDKIIYNKYREVINRHPVYADMLDYYTLYDYIHHSCISETFTERNTNFSFRSKLKKLAEIETNLIESDKITQGDLHKLDEALNKDEGVERKIYFHFLFLFLEKKMNPLVEDYPELNIDLENIDFDK